MNYTNEANLPAPLVSALTNDQYDYAAAGDISATALINPPRINQLMKRHSQEITEDVSERIWMLIGNIGHTILERSGADNVIQEERLSTELHGWTVTGKVDLIAEHAGAYSIQDWKFTSVWAVKDMKPEWEQQLNIYAALAAANGFHITKLQIVAILRDWSKLRAAREKDYPQVGVVVRDVPLWSPGKQAGYLSERVLLHQQARALPDDELPLCTLEERWRKPDVWAVKKKGNKRALSGGLQTSMDSARAFAAAAFNQGATEIEHRPGEDVRCLNYCAVKSWCLYGKTLAPAEETAA